MKFLVTFRLGLLSPTLSARMAATFQNQSQGRLLLNVVTGGELREQKALGDLLTQAERNACCDEFLQIVRRLWTHGEPFNFEGTHLRIAQARLQSVPKPLPDRSGCTSSPATPPGRRAPRRSGC